MKTLFVSYRVTDLDRSLGSYTAFGYSELGRVEVGDGASHIILIIPHEPAASLELVHCPGDGPVDVGSAFDHLAIQVETLATILRTLTEAGLRTEPLRYPGGPTARRRRGSRTRTVTGSNWWSGRRDIPMASPQRTSPEAVSACRATKAPHGARARSAAHRDFLNPDLSAVPLRAV